MPEPEGSRPTEWTPGRTARSEMKIGRMVLLGKDGPIPSKRQVTEVGNEHELEV